MDISGNNLKTAIIQRTHKQGRENALGADAGGQFLQGHIVKGAARVGLRLGEKRERDIAVFGGVDDSGFHDDKLLSSG